MHYRFPGTGEKNRDEAPCHENGAGKYYCEEFGPVYVGQVISKTRISMAPDKKTQQNKRCGKLSSPRMYKGLQPRGDGNYRHKRYQAYADAEPNRGIS
jgi:hypothetical protein